MRVKIYFCKEWNYLPKAFRAKEEIENSFKSADVELIASSGGIFDVFVDERLIYSKKSANFQGFGRFPKDGELAKIIGEF